MAVEKVAWKTKTEEDGAVISGEFEFDFPDTLAGCIEKFGEETCRLGLKKSVAIFLQAYARRQVTKEEKPMTPAEVAVSIPGLRITFSEREITNPVDKVLAQFGKLSDEKRISLLASLQEMLG